VTMSDTVKVSGIFVAETDKAILVEFPVVGTLQVKEVWFPRSQISYLSRLLVGDEIRLTMTVPEWLAEAKDVDYD
jgi:hypothetical protein